MSKSEAADTLLFHLRAAAVPAPEQEYRFHPDRRWAFDFAWPDALIAVEVDGGNHMVRNGRAVGRHTKPEDYEKLDEATVLGWRVLRFLPEQVTSGYALNCIERALGLIKESDDDLPF